MGAWFRFVDKRSSASTQLPHLLLLSSVWTCIMLALRKGWHPCLCRYVYYFRCRSVEKTRATISFYISAQDFFTPAKFSYSSWCLQFYCIILHEQTAIFRSKNLLHEHNAAKGIKQSHFAFCKRKLSKIYLSSCWIAGACDFRIKVVNCTLSAIHVRRFSLLATLTTDRTVWNSYNLAFYITT